jgi:predicted glycosyltransferase
MVNNRVKVVCSLRDISFRTRDDPEPERHRRNVLETLHRYFDAVLVHADPAVMRIASHIPWSGEIPIPVHYTGYVSEKPGGGPPPPGAGTVIASGGGAGGAALIAPCMAAWKQLQSRGGTDGRRLAVFAPLFLPRSDLEDLARQADGEHIRFMPFTADFLQWMKAADLSISQAGYNTCTNVLETRTRAVLVPNPRMSDQAPRARRLAELGLATVVDPAELDAERLSRAIVETLARPDPEHAVDLDGAANTRRLLEALCGHGT